MPLRGLDPVKFRPNSQSAFAVPNQSFRNSVARNIKRSCIGTTCYSFGSFAMKKEMDVTATAVSTRADWAYVLMSLRVFVVFLSRAAGKLRPPHNEWNSSRLADTKKNHASIQMFGTRTSEIALRVAYTADLRSLWRLVCLWPSVCPKRVTEPTLPLRFVALLKIAVSLSVHRVLRRKPCMHCLSAVEKLGICRFRRYKIMLVDASMYPKNHWKGHILCLAPL